jgi:hypothetical protein
MTQRRPSNTRQAFLFIALSLLLAFPHAALARSPQTSEPRPARRIIKRPSGFNKFGRDVIDILRCRTKNGKMRRDLLAYGPQFPSEYDPSDFSFWALVNTNWPMAVVYELEQKGTVVITIKVMGEPDFKQTFTGEGIGKLSAMRFTLPVYPEKGPYKGPHPAYISIKATRPGPKEDVRADFVFLGAMAGPDAIRSRLREPTAVEVAGLGPLPHGLGRNAGPPVRPQSDFTIYDITFGRGSGVYVFSFKTNGRFSRWGADIIKKAVVLKSTRDMQVATAGASQEAVEPDDPVEGEWDGRNGRVKVPPGKYSLRVRLWVEVYGSWAVEDCEPVAID